MPRHRDPGDPATPRPHPFRKLFDRRNRMGLPGSNNSRVGSGGGRSGVISQEVFDRRNHPLRKLFDRRNRMGLPGSNNSREGAARWGAARWFGTVLRPVTGLGWAVLLTAVVCWVLAARLGWVELRMVVVAFLVVFVLCLALAIGRTQLQVDLELSPRRVVVGNPAAGQVTVTNTSRVPVLPIELELPVGASGVRFTLPSLPTGTPHEELFVVPTERRGVVDVGPATTVRGDPLGLIRRTVSWTQVLELFVHPRTVALEALGSGLLRDLEGQTTNDVSMSDLAFHTLRDYAPGDDRRYIHWRSTAKVSQAGTGTRFLVRQFLDTRRSHLTVLVDGRSGSYGDPEQFETAVSAAASVCVRAAIDEMATTVLTADQVVHETDIRHTMDSFARAELGTGRRLPQQAAQAVALAPDTSVALMITGVHVELPELLLAGSYFAPEVTLVAIRVDPGATTGISSSAGLTILTLPQLADLPGLLYGSGL